MIYSNKYNLSFVIKEKDSLQHKEKNNNKDNKDQILATNIYTLIFINIRSLNNVFVQIGEIKLLFSEYCIFMVYIFLFLCSIL